VSLGASGDTAALQVAAGRWQCNDDRPSDPHKTVVLPARGHLNRHRIAATLSTSQHGQQCALVQGHHNSQAVGADTITAATAVQSSGTRVGVLSTTRHWPLSHLHAPPLMHDSLGLRSSSSTQQTRPMGTRICAVPVDAPRGWRRSRCGCEPENFLRCGSWNHASNKKTREPSLSHLALSRVTRAWCPYPARHRRATLALPRCLTDVFAVDSECEVLLREGK
jgi:hypothetical protein